MLIDIKSDSYYLLFNDIICKIIEIFSKKIIYNN